MKMVIKMLEDKRKYYQADYQMQTTALSNLETELEKGRANLQFLKDAIKEIEDAINALSR